MRKKKKFARDAIDFEKVFDSLEWKYRFKLLKVIIGPMFQKWIHNSYTYITSCVMNNGYASDVFQLYRGVAPIGASFCVGSRGTCPSDQTKREHP